MTKRSVRTQEEETFGQRMARFRKEAGFTQRDLADAIDISQRMIAYYEGQTDYPPAHLLPALVDVLGVSSDELLGIKSTRATRPSNQHLWRRFREIEKLPMKDRKQVLAVIDAFLERNQLAQRGR